MTGIASAPGKVILSGEHSVVYGYPALAGAIGLRCTVTADYQDHGLSIYSQEYDAEINFSQNQLVEIEKGKTTFSKFDNIAMAVLPLIPDNSGLSLSVKSQIPMGAGLGSSAAVTVASIGAVDDLLSLSITEDKINELAYKGEIVAHGKPSGIDNTVATFGGLIRYQEQAIKQIPMTEEIPMTVINTKVPRTTKKLVLGVADLKQAYPDLITPVMEAMSNLVDPLITAIQEKNLQKIGAIFRINHGLLDSIGVGHQVLSRYYWKTIHEGGALGSKLTGAGGGGCLISIFPTAASDRIREILDDTDVDVLTTSISPKGLIKGNEK